VVALEALIECPEKAVRMMLLDNVEFIAGQVGERSISQLLGSINDPLPGLRDATLKASLTLFPRMTEKQKHEAVRGFTKLCADDQPSIRTNAPICLSKSPVTLLTKDLAKPISANLRDSYPAARKMALTVVKVHCSLFGPEEIFCLFVPVISPLVLDKADMDIPIMAASLLKSFILKSGPNGSDSPVSPNLSNMAASLKLSNDMSHSLKSSPSISPQPVPMAFKEDAPLMTKDKVVVEQDAVQYGRKMRLGASRTLN
jgi:hypothetical protein